MRACLRLLGIALPALLVCACASIDYGPRRISITPEGVRLPTRYWRGVFLAYVDLPGHREQQLMLIDTGTDRTLFDRATAHRMGLASEEPEPVQTATGATVHGERLQRVPWLRIGGAEFHDIDAVGLDLSALREHGGLDIVGIAGCDLFRGCVLELGYGDRTARVLPLELAPSSPPIHFDGRTPVIDVELANQPMRALLDTGFQQMLALPPETVLPWRQPPRDGGDIAAIDGLADRRVARIAGELRIGELRWPDPWVALVPGSPKLGAAMLRGCTLRVDAKGGRLWIDRRR